MSPKLNPWADLKDTPPYVLPEDLESVRAYNEHLRRRTLAGRAGSVEESLLVHTEIPPEPYIGRPDAPVLLLGLNPGFSEADHAADQMPALRTAWRGTSASLSPKPGISSRIISPIIQSTNPLMPEIKPNLLTYA